MNKENEIVKKIIEKYNLDLGNDYFYVGATIIERSDFSQYTKILYCEDGFNDEEGIPYRSSYRKCCSRLLSLWKRLFTEVFQQ